jgi:hypothetical protein
LAPDWLAAYEIIQDLGAKIWDCHFDLPIRRRKRRIKGGIVALIDDDAIVLV